MDEESTNNSKASYDGLADEHARRVYGIFARKGKLPRAGTDGAKVG